MVTLKISERPKALVHSQSLCHLWLMVLHHYVVTGHAPIALKYTIILADVDDGPLQRWLLLPSHIADYTISGYYYTTLI